MQPQIPLRVGTHALCVIMSRLVAVAVVAAAAIAVRSGTPNRALGISLLS